MHVCCQLFYRIEQPLAAKGRVVTLIALGPFTDALMWREIYAKRCSPVGTLKIPKGQSTGERDYHIPLAGGLPYAETQRLGGSEGDSRSYKRHALLQTSEASIG